MAARSNGDLSGGKANLDPVLDALQRWHCFPYDGSILLRGRSQAKAKVGVSARRGGNELYSHVRYGAHFLRALRAESEDQPGAEFLRECCGSVRADPRRVNGALPLMAGLLV